MKRSPIPRRRGRKAEREQPALDAFRDALRDRMWCEAADLIDTDTDLPVCGRYGRHDGAHAHHMWPEDRDRGVHDPNRGKWLCTVSHRWTHHWPEKAGVIGLLRAALGYDIGMSRKRSAVIEIDALAEAVALERQLRDLRVTEDSVLKSRRHAWLRANRQGKTYQQIELACQVSDGLLCKELRRARREEQSEGAAA